MGLCAPTSNSYKRLVPGFEAPTILALSARNRSAACRVPMYFQNPEAKRVESIAFPTKFPEIFVFTGSFT